jgi:hypothetical protein
LRLMRSSFSILCIRLCLSTCLYIPLSFEAYEIKFLLSVYPPVSVHPLEFWGLWDQVSPFCVSACVCPLVCTSPWVLMLMRSRFSLTVSVCICLFVCIST